MTASEIRKSFLGFFESKKHRIVSSAPMVVKDDPSLMFTNAGMNQFKDIFLGNVTPANTRVTNSQKCLRVSGKHNDLEEVGHDSYHHTMFEMLGNWSFGDYFKEEAIDWAWEFLTEVLKIDRYSLYASVFEGDNKDKLKKDSESFNIWKKHLPQDRIIDGDKEDNFWEMGDVGPCGPCSEIHIDLRTDDEKRRVSGAELVNKDHPEVIEIWNLVFIQYNRKLNGELELLPHKHIDTGMGFERLCRVIQNKRSNYDTDIFQPIIKKISDLSGFKYGNSEESDIAMRVIADHIRTISFSIADGQLPSNNKAGYVIRRILRRAVRYGYTFLELKEPFMAQLIDSLISVMGEAFPELVGRKELIKKVITEEEVSFLKTLATGISLLDKIISETKRGDYKVVEGKVAFELYDTFGFPLDLTELILKEHGLVVNRREFETEMAAQKERARSAGSIETEDWVELMEDEEEEFIGYDHIEADVQLVKYRKVKTKKRELYHLVFNITPFYAESGGQIGDSGYIENNGEQIDIIDTKLENNLIIHITKKLPSDISSKFHAVVDKERRKLTAAHHSATHLLHKALREVLGDHIEQKGSLVHSDYLRFDFSHFEKVSEDEILKVERKVNEAIRANLPVAEQRDIPLAKARENGAIALFGEKYGDVVRTISFGDSLELCGGTHVKATGEIGFFKIVHESSVAAGIRRVEAVASKKAELLVEQQSAILRELREVFKSKSAIVTNVTNLIKENSKLSKQVDAVLNNFLQIEKQSLKDKVKNVNGVKVIVSTINSDLAGSLKTLAFQLRGDMDDEMVAVLGVENRGKPQLAVILSDTLIGKSGLNASEIIKKVASEIKGGGGGQPFFATAGGKDPEGLDSALAKAFDIVKDNL
ncbi:alanine--tRNA ligase [Marinilabiliaceae bacterium ANBcel2]|nr:alanine--tRNA ligase [Marinilabiliaceae bacterium ANBcel2]